VAAISLGRRQLRCGLGRVAVLVARLERATY
jgi:hypothetical protein